MIWLKRLAALFTWRRDEQRLKEEFEQHVAMGVLAAVCGRSELVGEEPQRRVNGCGHPTGLPTGHGWDCDVTLR